MLGGGNGLASTVGGLNVCAAEVGSSSREAGPSSSSATAAAATAPSADRPGLLTCQVLSCLAPTGKDDAPLLTCAGCGYVAYCCKDHQKSDWSLHKLFCKNVDKDGPLTPVVPMTEWMTEGMDDEQRGRWNAAYQELEGLLGIQNPAEHAAAVERAKAVLSDLELLLGRGHMGTVYALSSVTGLFFKRGMYDDAMSFSLRALKIVEDCYGPGDIRIAGSLNHYVNVIHGMGRDVDALVQSQRCLKIRESARGLNSGETAVELNNVAMILCCLSRKDEAVPLIRRSLAIWTALDGAGSCCENFAEARANLATILARLGRCDEALPLFEVALKSVDVAEGRDSVRYARISGNYACAMGGCPTGDPIMIVKMLEHSLQVLERMHSERDRDFMGALYTCARVNAKLHRWRRAAKQMDRCVTLISDGEVTSLCPLTEDRSLLINVEYGPGHTNTKEARELAALYRSRS